MKIYKILPTLFLATSVSASVQLSSLSPLVMDLKRSYLIDANTVLEFTPPTLKVGLNITNFSASDILVIEAVEVTVNYKHKEEVLRHKTRLKPKNIININSDLTYIETYSSSDNFSSNLPNNSDGISILKLEPSQSVRLGGDHGWVVLENLIPKQPLGYGGYMDVSFQESEIKFTGYYLNKSDGKKVDYEENIKFNPRRN